MEGRGRSVSVCVFWAGGSLSFLSRKALTIQQVHQNCTVYFRPTSTHTKQSCQEVNEAPPSADDQGDQTPA